MTVLLPKMGHKQLRHFTLRSGTGLKLNQFISPQAYPQGPGIGGAVQSFRNGCFRESHQDRWPHRRGSRAGLLAESSLVFDKRPLSGFTPIQRIVLNTHLSPAF